MKIYKNKDFNKWARKEKLLDESLSHAIEEIKQGLCEANLGGALYKKRVPIKGRKGKSSAYRTIVAYKSKYRAIFMYGFCKNQKDNIANKELSALKKLGEIYMSFEDDEIQNMIKSKILIEVTP